MTGLHTFWSNFFQAYYHHPIVRTVRRCDVLAEDLAMKTILCLIGIVTLLTSAGCVVSPYGGYYAGYYGEYPHAYYGYGYHHWHHPYDRDGYWGHR